MPTHGFSQGSGLISLSLVKRIQAAYRLTYTKTSQGESALWSHLNQKKKNIHDALIGEDIEQARKLLSDPASNHLLYGFDNLFTEETEQILRENAIQDGRASQLIAMLQTLSVAVGASRSWNPESALRFEQTVSQDTEELLSDIEKAIDASIDFPNPYPLEHGLITSRGVFSHRAYHAIYQAWRLKTLSRIYGPRLLEIGAGQGRTAYYAFRFGLRDYTIIDLPIANVAQAGFLGWVLGEDAILLTGEPMRPAAIFITTPEYLEHDQAARWNVILNADSLPEMPEDAAMYYASFAMRRADAFLSINHEAYDVLVHKLDPLVGLLAYRAPYWLRPGYVEEVFLNPRLQVERSKRNRLHRILHQRILAFRQ